MLKESGDVGAVALDGRYLEDIEILDNMANNINQNDAPSMTKKGIENVSLNSGNTDKRKQHHGTIQATENLYEVERKKRIQRNQDMLQKLGLKATMSDMVCGPSSISSLNDKCAARALPGRQRRTVSKAVLPKAPVRRSTRHQKLQERDRGREMIDAIDEDSNVGVEDELLDMEEYFRLTGKDVSDALRVDGIYHGWICPRVAEAYSVPEEGSDVSVLNTSIPHTAQATGPGWSKIRAKSAKMLRSNPNAFFYRHVAPDKQQAHGEWTAEEDALFMETARREGVGDRWGLFASHIGTRVGYQCSAYYAQVVIPSGRIIDSRFKMTRSGKAVFSR